MRYLMRLNAEKGTATRADVKGYYVGGKTGTAEKVINGRYSKNRLMTDFMAVLPADEPRYLMLIMLDEPKPIAETHGFATSGWNAAPTAAKVISRVAPLSASSRATTCPRPTNSSSPRSRASAPPRLPPRSRGPAKRRPRRRGAAARRRRSHAAPIQPRLRRRPAVRIRRARWERTIPSPGRLPAGDARACGRP